MNDVERAFIESRIAPLTQFATELCKGASGADAWAMLLLSLAAERMAYEVRAKQTADEYTRARMTVATQVELFRCTCEVTLSEGARVLAEALAADAALAEAGPPKAP